MRSPYSMRSELMFPVEHLHAGILEISVMLCGASTEK